MKLYGYKGRCNLAGEKIRVAREEAGMSQEQLAAKLQLAGLEITQKAVSRIETGLRVVPDYELIYFAEALSKDLSWMLKE